MGRHPDARRSSRSSLQGRRLRHAAAATILLLTSGCGGGGGGSSPLAPTPVATDPASATSITYSADVRPILDTDCVSCHNSSQANGGYNLSTYAGVLRAVTPGSAQSRLILVTRRGGAMYGNWRGNADQKAEVIRRWIVDFAAAE